MAASPTVLEDLNMAASPTVLEDLKYFPDDKIKNVHYLTICNATNMLHKYVWIRGPDFLIQGLAEIPDEFAKQL